jgi:hypothetical protein
MSWQRVGDSINVWVSIQYTGGTDAGAFTIYIPGGWKVDFRKIAALAESDITGASQPYFIVGEGMAKDAGVAVYPLYVMIGSAGILVARVPSATSTYIGDAGNHTNGVPLSAGIAAGDYSTFWFSVPIVGWR